MQNKVIVKPHIFDDRDAMHFDISDGSSINDFIKEANLPVVLNGHIRASINGIPATYDEFCVPLNSDDIVNIYVVPMGGGGGKSVLRMVAIIAVIAVAPYAGAFATLIVSGSATTLAVASFAFTALGMLAVNALIPPPKLDTGGYNASNPASANAYTITGQSNSISPYGVIPRLYGEHLFFPRLCGQPLVWNSGRSSYMIGLYDFGYAEIRIADVRLGSTSLDKFTVNTNYIASTKKDGLKYYTDNIDIQNIAVEVKYNNEIVRETAEDANTAEVEISLPRGLVSISDQGHYLKASVLIEVSYRLAGTNDSFISRNMESIGAGIFKTPLNNTVDILLKPTGQMWWNGWQYWPEDMQNLTVNTTRTIKAGELISNVLEGSFWWWFQGTGERRTVMVDVPAGNNRTMVLDRPFTTFSRSETNQSQVSKFFTNSVGTATINSISVSNNITDPFTVTAKMLFPTVGKYEIKVKRATADSTDSRLIDGSSWTLLRSFKKSDVLDLDTEHTLLELSIRANEQVNGVVQNLNAICSSKLRSWNGATFTNIFTSNPAWIILDILTGVANAGAIKDDQIDMQSFLDFADYCDEIVDVTTSEPVTFQQKRHSCNVVITSLTTVQDLVQSILSQARATLKISSNGRYGVMFDVAQSTPVQLFTNRNSSGFTSERSYADIPHALRVKYINPLQGYEIDEVIVYADGYDVLNAEKFEDLETFGITDYYEAYRHGRYTLAQMIAYQEVFTISVELEHLSVQRGQLVSVQNDVPRIGGQPLRVKEVLNSGFNIIVNDELVFNGIDEYHYLVRTDDNVLLEGKIDSVTDGNNIKLSIPNPSIKPLDVFVYGFKDFVTKDYIVSAIIPDSDLKAKITLTPYNPAVYTADVGVMPEYESGISPILGNQCRVEIQNLTHTYEVTFTDRLPVPTINITWEIGANAQVASYDIEWASVGIDGIDFNFGENTSETSLSFKLPNFVDNPSFVNKEVAVRIVAIGLNGDRCIPSQPFTQVLQLKQFPPSNVDFFNINVVSETLNLTWKQNTDPDIGFYVIKYHPSLDFNLATWERSTTLTDSIAYDTLRHTTNARKGTYLIKAIDTSGSLSPVASRAYTQIPEIVDLNFIEKVQDAPIWNGSKLNLEVHGNVLRTGTITSEPTCTFTMCDGRWSDSKPWSDTITWLDTPFNYAGTDYYTNGRYTFENLTDLGDVYTCRLSVELDAFGVRTDEFMYTWVTLSDLNVMASTKYDEWNAYILVKSADEISSIATWSLMSDVLFMSDGANPEEWTEEALVEMGDFTGRYFRFYLIVESSVEKVRVNVVDAVINVDMPDRIISDNDIISNIGGSRISFNPHFFVTPSLGITQDGAIQGDRFVISNKDKTGFDIEFFDAGDVSISSQFDYMAKAYGSLAVPVVTIAHDYRV